MFCESQGLSVTNIWAQNPGPYRTCPENFFCELLGLLLGRQGPFIACTGGRDMLICGLRLRSSKC